MAATEPRAGAFSAAVLLGVVGEEARAALTEALSGEGYRVEQAYSGRQMRARLLFEHFELLVVDAGLPGPAVLDAVNGGPRSPKVIIVAARVTDEVHHQAQRLGAVIVDPFLSARDLSDCAVGLAPPDRPRRWVNAVEV